MVEVQTADKKWIDRKKKGQAIKEFLDGALYQSVILPFLEGTKNESVRAAYLVLDNHPKLVACVSWHQAISTIQDSLHTAARDAEIDLENPPVEEEAPEYEGG